MPIGAAIDKKFLKYFSTVQVEIFLLKFNAFPTLHYCIRIQHSRSTAVISVGNSRQMITDQR